MANKPAPATSKPKPERPVGNRLSNIRITSANTALCVSFALVATTGVGEPFSFALPMPVSVLK